MAAGSRALLAFLSMLFIAGAGVLLFLVTLGGTFNLNVLDQIYFLEADTSGIPNAKAVSRWTLWSVCTVTQATRNQCPSAGAAYPLDPPRNFGTTQNIPPQFIGTSQYYYMTRFMFAFILIALFFIVCSFFLSALALCTRIGSYISGFFCLIATFFQAIAAALMTAAYVMGRNNFTSQNRSADLGRYAFGFMWGAFAAMFVASFLLCLAGGMSKKDSTSRSGRRFGRKRKYNRGSFIDNESQSRVNEEYK